MTLPPYQESGYDSDEQDAIAAGEHVCDLCGKVFAKAQGLAIHRGQSHKDEPGGSGSSARKSLRSLSQGGPPTPANGSVDALVHELALALLDQALDELRARMRAAL